MDDVDVDVDVKEVVDAFYPLAMQVDCLFIGTY